MKKSPLLRSFIVPCFRDTLYAGPSSVRSTSTVCSFVVLPNVILKAWRKNLKLNSLSTKTKTSDLTSLDLIKYRTSLPRRTAKVWLSNSGAKPKSKNRGFVFDFANKKVIVISYRLQSMNQRVHPIWSVHFQADEFPSY